MQLIMSDFKKGVVKLKVENLDDLWYLSSIIGKSDLITGKAQRKIKLNQATERQKKVIKKTVTIQLEAEQVEFHTSLNSLRISGIIRQAPEDIPRGSHHTLSIEENSIIKIEKKFLKYQIDKIKESVKKEVPRVLLITLDRSEASFALLKKNGYSLLSEIAGEVPKKSYEEKLQSSFYPEVIKKIQDYVKRYEIKHIILASPAFWKEELLKKIDSKELKEIITLATCNSTGKNGLDEILKRDEVKTVLKEDRVIKETVLVEELLKQISKNKMSVYGIKEVKEAADLGAINILLVTDSLIHKLREKDKFPELEEIMKLVESSKGEVHIISSDHEAGRTLDGLSGIGAILRYEIK